MSQPKYVHIAESDEVRPVERLPAARPWVQDRVAELLRPGQPRGTMFGEQGPDQGYALLLAEGFEHELHAAREGERTATGTLPGETLEDAIAGCVDVAMARASLFGRAPVRDDLKLAFTLFGFLGGAPEELVEHRTKWFQGCAHDYWARLAIKSMVPESTLRLSPQALRTKLDDWPLLLV